MLDDGYYGKGFYFTSSYDYAKLQSVRSQYGKVFLICAIIVGYSYPITEAPDTFGLTSFVGKNAILGYQSHYVVGKLIKLSFPFFLLLFLVFLFARK